MAGLAAARMRERRSLDVQELLAVIALICAVLVPFHAHVGSLDGLRIFGIGLGALAFLALL
jgi:hypothetical protein